MMEKTEIVKFEEFSEMLFSRYLKKNYNYTFRYAKEVPKGYKLFKVWKKEYNVHYELKNGHKIYYRES
jgi:hypothetical protein